MMIMSLASYLFIVVWMLVQRQWMYLVFLFPSVLMQIMHIATLISRSRHENSLSDSIVQKTACADDPTQVLLGSLADIVVTSRTDDASWQKIVYNWLNPSTHISVGAQYPNNQAFIDICAQGPHALVAGTTGSGKSVLLQRWVFELAMHNSPEAVQFIFLDFKGGSTFVHAHDLPHCVGNVSNLNIAHALRAIRALNHEMTRREQLISHARVSDIQDLDQPPARLIIMADEFFALMATLPSYTQDFSTMVSLGRALGIHFIISTQNPMNQVSSHIKANMPLHLCLRVTDPLQSLDLLGSPVAARIRTDCIGAAFISDGSSLRAVKIKQPADPSQIVLACTRAARFMHSIPPQPLFSAPLPNILKAPHNLAPCAKSAVIIGEEDDGIERHDFSLDWHHSARIIVITHMDAPSMEAAIHSIYASFMRHWWIEGKPTSTMSAASMHIIRDVTHYTEDLAHHARDDSSMLLITVPQWSRFLSSIPLEQRSIWESALVMCSAHTADSVYIPGHTLAPHTRELLKDYPTYHSHRVIIFDTSSHLVQLFSTNSSQTLEKSTTVWLPIEQDKRLEEETS
ncbi:FtsK/SpoIIIE domain-containing protein [Alloscardovia omnicolens]|uniref:FtsK/SpoIIIE domain-containing protein n=1 Tax=Alloscardovia omnicolens TaxID=419015 RepID=UPI003A5F072D